MFHLRCTFNIFKNSPTTTPHSLYPFRIFSVRLSPCFVATLDIVVQGKTVILFFADIVLVIHFCVVVFITSGFFLIPIGYTTNWGWTSNVKFRISHSGMMMCVTLETILGITCPLTYLENILRGINQSESFIGYWIQKFIFWDLPAHSQTHDRYLDPQWVLHQSF